jgi:hypothetical protein
MTIAKKVLDNRKNICYNGNIIIEKERENAERRNEKVTEEVARISEEARGTQLD